MTLHVFTARIGHDDPAVVDITRKSGDQFGRAFAPSWALLGPVLQARRAGGDMEREWPYLDLIDPQTAQERDLRGLVEYLLSALRSEQRVAREALEGPSDV